MFYGIHNPVIKILLNRKIVNFVLTEHAAMKGVIGHIYFSIFSPMMLRFPVTARRIHSSVFRPLEQNEIQSLVEAEDIFLVIPNCSGSPYGYRNRGFLDIQLFLEISVHQPFSCRNSPSIYYNVISRSLILFYLYIIFGYYNPRRNSPFKSQELPTNYWPHLSKDRRE